ncbi:hypothetical protein Bca101_060014 [Brassica carinata]
MNHRFPMGIVVVPLFPDVELQQWISWMENYFDRKGLTDFEKLHMAHGFIWGEAERYINSINSIMRIRNWKEMKETLLLRFGADDDPEKIKLQIESDRCLENVMNWKPQKKSATIQKKLRENDKKLKTELHSALGSLDTVSNRDVVYETEVEQVTKSPLLGESEEKLVAEMSLNVPDMVKKMALAIVDGVSVSSSDWHVSSSEAAQEAEVELKLASLQEMEHQAGEKREISADSCVEQTDSSLETVSIFSLVVEKLTDRMNSSKESVPETCLVSNDCLVPNCLLPAIMFQRASHSETEQETGVLVKEDTLIPLEQNMDSLQEHQLVQQVYSPSPVLEESDSVKFLGGTVIINAENVKVACVHRLCDHKFQRVPSKIRQWKCVKTWKFKFKRRSISKMVKRHWVQLKGNPSFKELRDVDVAHVYLVQVQRLSDVTLLTSEQQILEPRRKCYKSWHFKYKPGQAEMKEQHTQLHGLRVWIEQLRTVGKTMIPLQFKKVADMSHELVNRSCLSRHILEQSKLKRENIWQKHKLWLRVMRKILQALTHFLVGDGRLQVKHRWRFKQLHHASDHGSWGSFEDQLRWRLHQGLRRYLRKDHSFLWHRWRYKTLDCASVFFDVSDLDEQVRRDMFLLKQAIHSVQLTFELSEVMWQWWCLGLLQSGSCLERDSLIMLSSSLRSSLISREGVYKGAIAGLWLIDALFWWLAIASKSVVLKKMIGKQREETELSRHGMIQVDNHESLKERSSLVIHVKRHLLMGLLQQKQQQEKIYKSRMFKYKVIQRRFIGSAWSMVESFLWHKLVGKLVFKGGSIDRHQDVGCAELADEWLSWQRNGTKSRKKASTRFSSFAVEKTHDERLDINIVLLLHLFFMLCMLLFVDAMSLGTVAMRSS